MCLPGLGTALQLFAPGPALSVGPARVPRAQPSLSPAGPPPPPPSSALPSPLPASKWGGPEEWSEGTRGPGRSPVFGRTPPAPPRPPVFSSEGSRSIPRPAASPSGFSFGRRCSRAWDGNQLELALARPLWVPAASVNSRETCVGGGKIPFSRGGLGGRWRWRWRWRCLVGGTCGPGRLGGRGGRRRRRRRVLASGWQAGWWGRGVVAAALPSFPLCPSQLLWKSPSCKGT